MSKDQDDPVASDSPPLRYHPDVTVEFPHHDEPPSLPKAIGRLRIIKLLGEGGFGRVFLAHDDDLDRPVAIKVPRSDRIARPEDVEAYLAEARMVAKLDHPGIVPVFEVGRTDDGLCYVVSKFIEGSDLAHLSKGSRLAHSRAAEIVAAIAEGLHHAHSKGLVHRDIKPANLLIDLAGKAFVADFGLAIKEEDFGKGARHAGTPAYMSPEQARGEGHRVDGRSDIFSLGVVFFELLCGRRPFHGETHHELRDRIASTEARPPRQFDDTIPKELERICLKALSKRTSDRYSTARDMAEDLHHFLKSAEIVVPSPVSRASAFATPGSTQEATPLPPTSGPSDSDLRPIKIVPKGLRSFDEHDADFFIELLPGVRDRDGLPESLRFWKTRIEIVDPDKTFKVGLIYGPSGCGKSSMVKAGLIPRLSKHVHSVYIEATPDETESRLLRGLRKACPEFSGSLGLVEAIATIRRGRALGKGQKMLLVLDQFEQWLFAKRSDQDTELVAALRQCDGEHVQTLVMVRDDFWLAASRFMRDLEIRLLEGENSALVDLFDLRHATKVLTAFGRAYGALPENPSDFTPEHKAFTDQSVTGLAQDDKVISVRLALFAEMVKGKPWTPNTLKAVGGTQGVGVTFLEETFSATTAPPEHRLHQKAAQAVLKALLPETGTNIKGEMKSETELKEASGYANRHRDFDDLIQILDSELRLITPTDPEGSADEVQANKPAGGRYYQFTHDYLVPSLREWLTRKQRETRRGRAELKLAERSATWNAKPENRLLPSVTEWASIRLLTRQKDWTEPQWRMMRRAGRWHALRGVMAAALLLAVVVTGVEVRRQVIMERRATIAAGLVDQVLNANTTQVPGIVDSMAAYRRWTDPALRTAFDKAPEASPARLHASLALLPVDASQVDYIYGRLLEASPDEVKVIRDALRNQAPSLTEKLWSVVEAPSPSDPRRLRAASALALYDPASPRWTEVSQGISQSMVAENPVFVGVWIDELRPVRSKLSPSLAVIFRDKARIESERSLATSILAEYVRDDPALLSDLLMDAEPKAFSTLFKIAEKSRTQVMPIFRAEVARKADPSWSEADKDRLAERQARAAISLVRLGQADEVWPLLKHSADPRLRSFIVNWLNPLGGDPELIATGLERIDPRIKPSPVEGQQAMDAVLFHPETSIRRALILALGTYGTEGLLPAERDPLIVKLFELYRNDPDAGIHGASEWTLLQWKQQEKLRAADADLMTLKDRGDRRWFINSQGQTFAVIDGPVEFLMGSPPTEPEFNEDETSHRVRIPRRFAIASKEVSVEQYQKFLKANPDFGLTDKYMDKFSPDPSGPMIGVSWYRAAAYCNWLSEQDGLPREQWAYLPDEKTGFDQGMTIPANVLQRTGYRFPTEAEWEYACRSGTLTSRYHGLSTDLLGTYARNRANSQEHAWPCGRLQPNELGLFDMLGNVYERCQDKSRFYSTKGKTEDNINTSEIVDNFPRMIRGGSFSNPPSNVRSAHRSRIAPLSGVNTIGFRPSRTYP